MRADCRALRLAMARACLTTSDLPRVAQMPRSTVNNVLSGKKVRPATLGKVARALGVDAAVIMLKEET